jgi:multiple sugar transport system permease protein
VRGLSQAVRSVDALGSTSATSHNPLADLLGRRLAYLGKPNRILATCLAVTASVPFLVPLFWMFWTSLASNATFSSGISHVLTNTHLVFGNYRKAVDYFPFWRDTWNTTIIASLSAAGTVVSCSLAGYGFSMVTWRGRDTVFWIVLATTILPAWSMIIPLYSLYLHIGWVDTFLPLIVPNWLGASGFSIFLIRQFLRRQPMSIVEAARIDGASELRIFRSIVVPLARPVLVVVGMLNFVGNWTDFFQPLVFLTSPDKMTLMLGLQAFQQKEVTNQTLLMAACTLSIIPVVVVFFLGQRRFETGLTLGLQVG